MRISQLIPSEQLDEYITSSKIERVIAASSGIRFPTKASNSETCKPLLDCMAEIKEHGLWSMSEKPYTRISLLPVDDDSLKIERMRSESFSKFQLDTQPSIRHKLAIIIGIGYLSEFVAPEDIEGRFQITLNIGSGYNNVPYHNLDHGIMVAHYCMQLTNDIGILPHMSNSEKEAFLYASLGHDVGHPGYSGSFLVDNKHSLAIETEGTSVLEKYHASRVLDILDKCKWPHLGEAALREQIYEWILATDINLHHEYVERITNIVDRLVTPLDVINNRRSVLSLIIKIADIGYLADESKYCMLSNILDYYTEVYYQSKIERGSIEIRLSDVLTPPWSESSMVFSNSVLLPMIAQLNRVKAIMGLGEVHSVPTVDRLAQSLEKIMKACDGQTADIWSFSEGSIEKTLFNNMASLQAAAS